MSSSTQEDRAESLAAWFRKSPMLTVKVSGPEVSIVARRGLRVRFRMGSVLGGACIDIYATGRKPFCRMVRVDDRVVAVGAVRFLQDHSRIYSTDPHVSPRGAAYAALVKAVEACGAIE